MKKDLIFSLILLVVGIALGLLKVTGMTAHIVISLVGVGVLIAYTVVAKKEWKIPALEIAMRVSYGLALISGIVLKINYVAFLGILHKVFAIVFLVAHIVIFTQKILANKI